MTRIFQAQMSFTFAIMVQPPLINAPYIQSQPLPQVKHPYNFENVHKFVAGASSFSPTLFPAMTCAAFTEKCFNSAPLISRSFNFLNPRAAVRNLKIPPLYYEILVVGSDQKIDDGIRPLQCATVTHRVYAHAMF
jgi:hypothetical protein